jgi:hypothetical protein
VRAWGGLGQVHWPRASTRAPLNIHGPGRIFCLVRRAPWLARVGGRATRAQHHLALGWKSHIAQVIDRQPRPFAWIERISANSPFQHDGISLRWPALLFLVIKSGRGGGSGRWSRIERQVRRECVSIFQNHDPALKTRSRHLAGLRTV